LTSHRGRTTDNEDVAKEDLIQKILFEAPEFEECLVSVYINENESSPTNNYNEKIKLVKITKPCPSCNNRELHVFHVDKETLLDLDLPKESDTFEVDFYVSMCRACNHYFQIYKR